MRLNLHLIILLNLFSNYIKSKVLCLELIHAEIISLAICTYSIVYSLRAPFSQHHPRWWEDYLHFIRTAWIFTDAVVNFYLPGLPQFCSLMKIAPQHALQICSKSQFVSWQGGKKQKQQEWHRQGRAGKCKSEQGVRGVGLDS